MTQQHRVDVSKVIVWRVNADVEVTLYELFQYISSISMIDLIVLRLCDA